MENLSIIKVYINKQELYIYSSYIIPNIGDKLSIFETQFKVIDRTLSAKKIPEVTLIVEEIKK